MRLRPGSRARSRALGQLILVAARIAQADDELRAYEFCDERLLKDRLRPSAWRRLAAALDALRTGQAQYLHDGRPV